MWQLDFLRWLHVIGAAILLGTWAGIAFFMLLAHRTSDPRLIAHVASTVLIADFLFTATAVIAQPITGYLLARLAGWPLTEGWLLLSVGLYILTGCFWLPVVVIQIKLRNVAEAALRENAVLPPMYYTLFRVWFACGVPAFASVLMIFWLMLTKPQIGSW